MSTLISTGACPFCGNGKSTPCFATYENGYFCFTCGAKKSVSENHYSFRTTKLQSVATQFPTVTCNFSPSVLQWLYQYYVFEDLISKYNIYYSPESETSSESLIFGVYRENELVFWQQRFFPRKRFVTGGNKNEIFFITNPESDIVVLVEDYISAIRVGEHANALCLWGVHVNYVMSKLLENLNMNILVWLDPDEAGQTAAQEVNYRLTKSLQNSAKYKAFAVRESRYVSVLETGKQPKEYSDQEIISILGEQCVKNN